MIADVLYNNPATEESWTLRPAQYHKCGVKFRAEEILTI